ncbi:MAG: mechanosensitive ion channel family protein [Thermoanaerobaculia bacterium]
MQLRQFLVSGAESFRELSASVIDFLPRLLAALLLIAVGWGLARLLRGLVRRIAERFERLVRRRTGGSETREQRVATELAAGVVFWLVLLLFVAAATEQLGLAVVTQALSALAAYLPAALGAIVILLVAFLVADFAKRGAASAAAASGLGYAELLGELTRIGIFVVAGVLALDQLGANSTILVVLSTTLLGGLVGGAALAFGLGARTTVSNILASHYVVKTYRVGQTIRLEGVTGRIVETRPTQIVLDTAEGLVAVPAKLFSESMSTLVDEEG